MILVDRGYIGESCFLQPFKPAISNEEKEFNSTISSIYETIKHTIERIKIFQFTQHKSNFKVICLKILRYR